jgi:cyclin-dependent kinase 7
MENFTKTTQLGEGQFGIVYLATDLRTNQQVALKKIRLGADRAKEGVHFTALREIKFLTDLRHPNVLLLHETFQHKNNIFLVLEVMHTDLEIVIKAKQIPLPLRYLLKPA